MTAPALDILYVAAALPAADADLAYLTAEVDWIDHMRARQTASFGAPYNYSGQQYPACAMPPVIAAIAERAAALAGHPFNNCLCNRYETGSNTMGFHSDSYVPPGCRHRLDHGRDRNRGRSRIMRAQSE